MELDQDMVWISEEDIPDHFKTENDLQTVESISEFMETRDISINEVLWNPKANELIASEQAIQDARFHLVRQKEYGIRAALRTIRIASILNWEFELLHSLEDEEGQYFEFQVSVQFLRSAQSGASQKFLDNLKKSGIDIEDFEYHKDLLPEFSFGSDDEEDDDLYEEEM